MNTWGGGEERNTKGRVAGLQVSRLKEAGSFRAGRWAYLTLTLPKALGVLLTGELSPLGPGVVDASKSEAPQPFIEQLPVPDSKTQEDAVDLVLRWRLQV